jgi:hypothetical protein
MTKNLVNLEMMYKLPQQEIDIYDQFSEVYEPYLQHRMGLEEIPNLPLRRTWICRFCGRGFTTTTFKNDPHRFSKLFCNSYGIWGEECDACNSRFSTYERNLGAWLGLHRVFSDIRPGNKRFIFSSSDGSVQSRRLGQIILFEQTKAGGIEGSMRDGQIAFNATPLPYTPALVYQAFLKNALSALLRSDLSRYQRALITLQIDAAARRSAGFRTIDMVESDRSIVHPTVLLYRRKGANQQYPLHMYCLYVRNFMFQLALPLEEEGISSGTESLTFLAAHYLYKQAQDDRPFIIIRSRHDLESWEEVVPEKSTIILRPDPEAMQKLVSVQLPPDFMEKLKKSW